MAELPFIAIFGASSKANCEVANLLARGNTFKPRKIQTNIITKAATDVSFATPLKMAVAVFPPSNSESHKTAVLSKQNAVIIVVKSDSTSAQDDHVEQWVKEQLGRFGTACLKINMGSHLNAPATRTIRKGLLTKIRELVIRDDGCVPGRRLWQSIDQPLLQTSNNEHEEREEVFTECHGEEFNPLSLDPGDAERKLYRDTLHAGSAPSNLVPVIVLGNENAGKTTLIKRLLTLDDPSADVCRSCMACYMDKGELTWNVIKEDFSDDLNLQRMSQAMQAVREQQTANQSPFISSDFQARNDTLMDDDNVNLTSDSIGEVIAALDFASFSNTFKKDAYLKEVVRTFNQCRKERTYFNFREYSGLDNYVLSHRQFMSPRAVYLLVVDISLDLDQNMSFQKKGTISKHHCLLKGYTVLESVKFWATAIRKHDCEEVRAAPIILVANRTDQLSSYHARLKMEQIKAMLYEIDSVGVQGEVSIDCKNDDGTKLEMLKTKLVDISHNHSSRDIPAKWIEIEHILLQKKREMSSCTFNEIEALAHLSDVPVENRDNLLEFLTLQHDLGQIIFFPNSVVQNHIVLRPNLLTEIVHTVKAIGKADRTICKEGLIAKKVFKKAKTCVEEKQNVLLNLDIFLDMILHLKVAFITNGLNDDYDAGDELMHFAPFILDTNTRQLTHESITESVPTIQIQFKEEHVHPSIFHQFLFYLLEQLNSHRRQNFDLFSRIFLLGEVMYVDTFWIKSAVYMHLKNISKQKRLNKIDCPNLLNSIRSAARMLGEGGTQCAIDYQVNIECNEHSMCFVKLETLETMGEAMCESDTCIHAVTSTAMGVYGNRQNQDLLRPNLPAINRIQRPILNPNETERVSDKVLGRIAWHLEKENQLSLARLLDIFHVNWVAKIADEFQDMQDKRMAVMHAWAQQHKDCTLPSLKAKLARSYAAGFLNNIIYMQTEPVYFELSPAMLNAPPSDAYISVVSLHITGNYKFVFLELGLSWREIKEFQTKFYGDKPIIELLCNWRNTYQSAASLRVLLTTLFHFRYNTDDIIIGIRRLQ